MLTHFYLAEVDLPRQFLNVLLDQIHHQEKLIRLHPNQISATYVNNSFP